MIAAIYARILVATLALLTLATSASAECAWVLWNEITSAEGKEWVLVQAAPTALQCDRFLTDKLRDAGKTAKTVEGNQVATEVGDKLYTYRFTCVPDTIDPRGPKGPK